VLTLKLSQVLPVDNIRQVVPEGWPAPVYAFENNPLSEDGFALGRALFYEKMLSRDNTISCGSCHQQFVAFAHSEHKFSHGIDGLLGTEMHLVYLISIGILRLCGMVVLTILKFNLWAPYQIQLKWILI
jgi:hypothetical protein